MIFKSCETPQDDIRMSDNAKMVLKLDNQTVSEVNALRSWGPLNFG